MPAELPPGVAHLWYLRADDVRDPELRRRYLALLAPDELARHDRYLFPELRDEYLFTRALVRTALSRYIAVAPESWTFVSNAHGRPAIAGPAGADWLRFNLSNTRGLVACAVARAVDVGVDVEDTLRKGRTVEIADDYFSAPELASLRALPAERQRERFFTYWTLKEAYIKARGLGLAIPLDQFSFDLGDRALREPADDIGISFDPRLADDPGAWQFALYRPTERHLMAAAIHKGAGAPFRIEVRRTLPLTADEDPSRR